MREYRFPKACEVLWVDALKVIAAQGFGLVGNDRELAGQEKQGVITNFLNRGHATTRDDDGVFEAESDANGQGLRFLVTGKPAGTDGCFVQYFAIQEDRANSTEARHRDYDQELLLLARVDRPPRPASSRRPTRRGERLEDVADVGGDVHAGELHRAPVEGLLADVHVAGLGAEQDRSEDEVHARAADGQEGELGAGEADAAAARAREVREAADARAPGTAG